MPATTREKLLNHWVLGAVLLVLSSQPLLARSRDDVLTAMFHCAAIGDTRMWLDCFYGAAQPLRAELGLQPAPAGQVRLSQNPPAGAAPAGDLGPRYQATTNALGCNSVSGDRQWLDCYYGAAQPVRAQLGLSPAPQAPIATSAVPAGGASVPGPQSASLPASQTAALGRSAVPAPDKNSGWLQVTSYSFNRYGIFTLSLSNGQQWRQLSGDTSFAHWNKPPAHYWVRITRGALRSLNLKVKDEPAAYKVERFN